HAKLVDSCGLPREERAVRGSTGSGCRTLDIEPGPTHFLDCTADGWSMKCPSNQSQLSMLDRLLALSDQPSGRGRGKDFEVTTTAQRDERVLSAAPWMFAASFWAHAGP